MLRVGVKIGQVQSFALNASPVFKERSPTAYTRYSNYSGSHCRFLCCSTISSGLNSLAAVTFKDIVGVLRKTSMTDEREALISKFIAAGYGLICVGLTFIIANLGGILQVQ